MNLSEYLKIKRERAQAAKIYRRHCGRCKKPEATCYCTSMRPFRAKAVFVILMHRMEVKRSIATGRMTHLCLTNSVLFEGTDFTEHAGVNALIADPDNHCVVLSPGPESIDLSKVDPPERATLFPRGKQLVIFVIDGTWSQARRMKRLSQNLHRIPSICFTPTTPSGFKVRKQPAAYCYSTIEAVHACIELTGAEDKEAASNLLRTFSYMVEQQVEYQSGATSARYRVRPPL